MLRPHPSPTPFGTEVERRMAGAIVRSMRGRWSLRRAYERLCYELCRDGLPVPSHGTFLRRARNIAAAARMTGRRRSQASYMPPPRPAPPRPRPQGPSGRAPGGAGVPIRYVLVDHALVDIVVLDGEGRALGKPLVTMIAHVTVVDGIPHLHARRCEVSVPTGAR